MLLVTVAEDNTVTVKGPKGIISYFQNDMNIKVEENKFTVERPSDNKLHRSLHGTTRALSLTW